MVIVKLIGGLGNQLFQYAAARRLAVLHQTTLKLDITPFESYKWHRYSLGAFRIQEVLATLGEIAEIRGSSRNAVDKITFGLGQSLKEYYRRCVFSERHFGRYDPNIMKTPKHVYLDGYWQSEKYFVDIQDAIRREFVVRHEQDCQSRGIAAKIANAQSVSIHVRRGDYVSNLKTRRVHGVCGLDYYEQCVTYIAERIACPHFFVFSDDPRWATENLRLDYPTTFVTHNDATRNYEDLRLMGLCHHHIIANSSFSWWGAWLCANPRKIVLVPERWFATDEHSTEDLIPDAWNRI